MDDHARQHDPDQIVASETGPAADIAWPAHDRPQSDRRDAEHHHLPVAPAGPGQQATPPAPPAPPVRPVSPPPSQGFWGYLTEIERNDLLARVDEVVYPVGTVLWFEGQTADQAVVIQSGSIRVSINRGGRERIIAFRRPGDIVGERAALLLRRRSATIVAMDTVRGLRLSTQQFVSYLSDHPRVVAVLERELYDRLTEQSILLSQPQSPSPYMTTDRYQPNAPHDPAVQYGSITSHGFTTPQPPTAPLAPVPPHLPDATQLPGATQMPDTSRAPNMQNGAQRYATVPMPLRTPQDDQVHDAAAVNGGAAYAMRPQNSVPGPGQASALGPFEEEPTQPMTAGRNEPAGVTWAGQNCTIVFTDIAGFSATHRNDRDRLDMRRAMYALLSEAFMESGVPWAACHIEDRGDGALIVVPPEVPTAAVIDPMIASLAEGLRHHNQRSRDAVRIQLRVAVHVGPVMPDPPGVSGWALIRTARLLDARPLKDRLAATGADLGFIASTFVYESVIVHGPGYVNPAEYEPVSCTVKKLKTEGWIHLRGVPARSAI
ncbi:cyclic nucleotide-binding domain-containing protein [Actinomadura sp. KC216]|uniref:cyclic nucleotide-binding domain-containing protein n=1 Tax=Actinomadura sp. KC216 TaxID=2530370 RepID=UPI001047003E|nr:cyclic nucleotide-binding domain-containing protein [Actinomadura sp. KC216]TDB81216.1 cyclic nucleotide-binding domain-containing protein [Actinomadura sp. KC216]